MTRHRPKRDCPNPQPEQSSVWWAAVIDEQGNEVRITEGMIHRACEELACSWTFPRMTDSRTAHC